MDWSKVSQLHLPFVSQPLPFMTGLSLQSWDHSCAWDHSCIFRALDDPSQFLLATKWGSFLQSRNKSFAVVASRSKFHQRTSARRQPFDTGFNPNAKTVALELRKSTCMKGRFLCWLSPRNLGSKLPIWWGHSCQTWTDLEKQPPGAWKSLACTHLDFWIMPENGRWLLNMDHRVKHLTR